MAQTSGDRASRFGTWDKLGRALKHGTIRDATKFTRAKAMGVLSVCSGSAASSRRLGD